MAYDKQHIFPVGLNWFYVELTERRDLKQEKKRHPDKVVDCGEDSADDALGRRVHELNGQLEEDRAAGVGETTAQDHRQEQLGWKK